MALTEKLNAEVLTANEAVIYLKITKPTLLKLIHENKIPAQKVGRQYRILKAELEKYLRGETEEKVVRK
jgi:excisionase family DNA binding protein